MKTTITVERRNQKGVYAKELGKWLNYSRYYKGNELSIGTTYMVELDGDFIMKAEPLQRVNGNGNGNGKESSLINSPAYLSLKLAVELYASKNIDPSQVISTARMFKKYLEEEL